MTNKNVKVTPKTLFAFWKYTDTKKTLIGGEVESMVPNPIGNVTVVGYPGYIFRPVAIVNYEEGLKIEELIKEARFKTDESVRKLHADHTNYVYGLIDKTENDIC